MNRARHVLLITILSAAIGFTLYQALLNNMGISDSLDSNPETGIEIGAKAPDFTLETLEGEKMTLSELEKPVMLNFWASWCPPCKAEIPHMVNFYDSQEGDVEIIAVNMLHQENSEEDMKGFHEEYALNFPVPLDENGRVTDMYQVKSIPTSYFIDSNGYIAYKYTGPMTEQSISSTFGNID
ncbi:redoxin domain-containing protein [Salinicoccus bachuensis]|uniref:Redoxin domain-containing protein n=1 Tax=Salinicoccus bachuensis TaxID=3136731 RepID=A0ABZ3CIT4_9STAP